MKGIRSVFTQYQGLSPSVWVIFFARIVTNMGAFIWPMLTMILSTKMGYSSIKIAVISAAVMVLFMPVNIIGGKLADRFNKKKIIIIFDLISVAFFMACAWLEPGNLMVLFFILAGLFANLEGPSFEALIIESTLPKEREKVFSLTYLGHNLGFMFGAAIGGLLIADYLNIAFIIDGLTTLTSTFLIVAFVKVIKVSDIKEEDKNEYEDHADDQAKAFDILKQRKSVFIQMITFSLGAFIYSQWSFVLPLYMSHIFGEADGPKIYGFLGSFNAFVVIALTSVLTLLLNRLMELPKILIGMALYSFSYLLLKGEPGPAMFFVMMFMFTLGEIINSLGSSPFVSRRMPASHRGRISSIIGIGYMVGNMAGQLIAGTMIEKAGYEMTFNMLAIVGFASVLLTSYNIRVDKKLFPKLYETKARQLMADEG